MKKCFKCEGVKPLTEFYKHPGMTDGRLGKCKECNKRDVSENYQKNKAHYRAYERARFQNKDRKAKVLMYQRKMRKNNPDKYKARSAVSNAIRDGRMDRASECEKCGSDQRVQAHHSDYAKPFEVDWLCFVCHRSVHNQEAQPF